MTSPDTQTLSPITEDDIANYLLQTPDFFERHAEVLATVQPSRTTVRIIGMYPPSPFRSKTISNADWEYGLLVLIRTA